MALKTYNDTNINIKVEFETSDDELVVNKNECLKEGNTEDVVVKVEFIKEVPTDYELEVEQPKDNCSVMECLFESIGTTNYEDNQVDNCNTLNEINLISYTNKFPSNQSNKKLSKEKKITYKRIFACTSCDKKFSTKDHLKRHVSNNCRLKHPFICDVCDKEYRYRSLLIVHIRSHTGERPFTCNLCGKKFCHRSGVNEHKKIHTDEKPFQCNVCDKKFRQKYDLKLHMLIHTGEKLNACYLCEKKFRRQCDLNVHIRTHTGEKPYGCNLCKKKFNTKFNLDLHGKTHTKEKCNSFSNSALDKHKKPCIRRPITKKCVLIKDAKTHSVDFISSVVAHTTSGTALYGNIPVQSNRTDTDIKNNTSTYVKQESIPFEKGLIVIKIEPVEEYVIDKNERLKGEEDFAVKEESVTAVERWPFNEPIEYNSASNSLLSESTEISGTFTCDICNRQFQTKRNLRRHTIIHSENRSFYICEVCKRRCLHKKTLAVHMRTHTGEKPFACTMCNKTFRQRCDLTKHMRAHTGEKPFSCPVCNKKFSQKYNLKMHARTHSGERPFACDECEKTFLQKCSLTKHKKTHGKEKSFREKVI